MESNTTSSSAASSEIQQQDRIAAATATPAPPTTTTTTTTDFAYLYAATDTPIRERTATHYSSSSPSSSNCGCGIPWTASTLAELKNCPVSGEPVAMVCDGGVVALALAEGAESDGESESESEPESPSSSVHPIVRFRFGTILYQLSTMTATTGSESERGATPAAVPSSWWWWWSRKNAADDAAAPPQPKLAQDRIAEALDLPKDGLKILHKGKLLWDARKTSLEKQQQQEQSSEQRESLSRRLLEISEDDWTNHNNSRSGGKSHNKKWASLVVMGTPRQRALREPPSISDDNALASTTSGWRRALRPLSVPVTIVGWSLHFVYSLVVSFFGPFLPASWWNPGSNSNAPQRDRPHRD